MQEAQAIEVEVVEIDGLVPRVRQQPEISPGRGAERWRQLQGRILHLNARWWPLWIVLGAVILVLLLTVGVIAGILLLIYKILRGFVRMLIS